MWWSHLIHLGDLPFTIGAAAATTMWLIVARARRLAFWWSVLFAAAIATVGASKVAAIMVGSVPTENGFHALSGHAAGVTAVAIMVLYVVSRRQAAIVRLAGVAVAMGIGAAMVAMLVLHDDHSLLEAYAGWLIGAAAGVGVVWAAGCKLPARVPYGLAWSAAVFIATALVIQKMPVGYWMVRIARVFAQHTGVFAVAG